MKLKLFPSKKLRVRCSESHDTAECVSSLKRAVQLLPAAGLSSNQLGFESRVIIFRHDGKYTIAVNPEVEAIGAEEEHTDGCLSVLGITGKVTRSNKIRLKYKGEDGVQKETELSGRDAFNVQHQVEHLDGMLFIDRLSVVDKVKMQPILKRLKKLTKNKSELDLEQIAKMVQKSASMSSSSSS